LHFQANHDPLTGLGNRVMLADRLERLRHGPPAAGDVAVLCVDVDHFKDINDQQGHPFGDLVLVEVASRLRDNVRPGDTIVRMGGDEFVILCDRGSVEAATQIADRLLTAMTRPIVGGDIKVLVSLSVGVGIAPSWAIPEATLAVADRSLYVAKRAGRARRGPLCWAAEKDPTLDGDDQTLADG